MSHPTLPHLPTHSSIESNNEAITLIWLDKQLDDPNNIEDVLHTKRLLKEINDSVLFYIDPKQCVDYIKRADKEKIFLIISGSLATDFIADICHVNQIDSIFIFCTRREKYEYLIERYEQVVDVFTYQDELTQSVQQNVDLVKKQSSRFGIFDEKQCSTKYLKRESATFLWSQLLPAVLKKVAQYGSQSNINEIVAYCNAHYRGHSVELLNIQEFKLKYKPEEAILWYAKQTFIYNMVNKALRTEDVETLGIFHHYITNLCANLAHEHKELQITSKKNSKMLIIKLYRGFKMTTDEIHKVRENIGGLISMNGFFSTSRREDIAIKFATKPTAKRKNIQNVLLEIEGDIGLDTIVFGDTVKWSEFPEEQEVIFDLGTVFRIVHVEHDGQKKMWTIQLAGISDSRKTVDEYIDRVRKEMEETSLTLLFSRLICDIGEYNKSEMFLKRMLALLPENHADIPHIYLSIGRANYFKGELEEALNNYNLANTIIRTRSKTDTHSDIARVLHHIGNIYLEYKQYDMAIDNYTQALIMKQKTLSKDHPSIANTLDALGVVHKENDDYQNALIYFNDALAMKQRTLSKDHPSIADTLNNIGSIYEQLEQYDKALEYHQKSLKIKQTALSNNHPSIVINLNAVGNIYVI
ncbi:unnamed protein product, partial [Didymodactylos carnosus]